MELEDLLCGVRFFISKAPEWGAVYGLSDIPRSVMTRQVVLRCGNSYMNDDAFRKNIQYTIFLSEAFKF